MEVCALEQSHANEKKAKKSQKNEGWGARIRPLDSELIRIKLEEICVDILDKRGNNAR